MLTGEDGEKGLFVMQVGWFSVYIKLDAVQMTWRNSICHKILLNYL